ncbi:non-ribosomal peptide synthetase [Streptomyces sp. NRRL WC-3742]|uniref:non-ribosomal peptide synthetase n=1 Tax=Streptomyces sp. NRRL WC-3742 TaxID=1463934 RepID=UPI0004C82B6F|nr:non-ribosomal peptide synthetase [Streptomyces sp. NRRL WC-3742]
MAFEAIHSLVARSVARFPDRTAVETADAALSYRALDERADRVAAQLHRAGARAGSLVSVLAPDRADLATALLAVLRLGAVAAPLDGAAQTHRLSRLLSDAPPEVLLVGAGQEKTAAEIAPAGLPLLELGAVQDGLTDDRGADYPRHVPGPDDPCYLFFTSGSTGRSKAILGRLGAVDHYLRWEAELLGVDSGWRVGQLISPAFDAVLRDLLLPLSVGATAVAPAPELRLDPAALAHWIDGARVDLVHCVPSVFRSLLPTALGDDLGFPALRCVALSGERLVPADAARWFDRYGERVRLLNLYGPSETTMTKLYHFVTPADTALRSIPIGRPMPDTEVLLLDERGEPVPEGRVGEIHLRTPYAALGYHRDPEATAAAFTTTPGSGSGPALTVYRTGDFGRLLPGASEASPAGTLEFLGRKDHQVKIGGVRVELEEVEALLREHPSVAEAAVILTEPDGAPPLLCAFVESSGTSGASGASGASGVPDTDLLREHLAERLHPAAVPSVIVPARIPRTVTGKIDRKALRPPAPAAQTPADDAVAPRNATERTVAAIWTAVLAVPIEDVRTRFFTVGGSLAVITVLSRIKDSFGVSLTLADFLAHQTVEGIARLVEKTLVETDADDDLFGSPL